MAKLKMLLQLFGASGTFPTSGNVFKINIVGRTANPGDYVTIKDIESFKISVDTKTEEWYPIDLAGWVRQAVVGKKLTISLSGKRSYGDPGNDFLAGTLLSIGQTVQSSFSWTLPNGANITFDCVISIKTPSGGDVVSIDDLEVDILSDGLPVYTAAGTLSTLTYSTVGGSVTGKTKVSTITPALTGGNSYVYKVGVNIAALSYGNVLTQANGWLPYTLGADITATTGAAVVICEVDSGLMAKKGGTASAIVT